MTCLICLDETHGYWHPTSVTCECKFEVHKLCWDSYVSANANLKCPLCRKLLYQEVIQRQALSARIYYNSNDILNVVRIIIAILQFLVWIFHG